MGIILTNLGMRGVECHERRGHRARAACGPPRPHAVAAVVPAASVPLSFLAAAAAGLAGCGLALAWASRPGADPTAGPVAAAAHLGVLAALSMGALGARTTWPRLSRTGRCGRYAWRA